ncbi:selenide, water dikinase SelD [Arcobacter vandammei]|uniref:selenide, water dikinase SelD n=1 Tax=Arcobacter vandammei TaxID=2782243 RepID=UPI0018DF84A7|nr:selenide, water dikinase SelD [Arcobacter vandammei]
MNNEYKLTKFVQAAGCAAKMGPGDLKQALCHLKANSEQVLVGFDTSDDAGVYQLSPDLALVQTVDFITPVIDDPYIYGQIAAANSLSDVFAMGGEVKTALNIVGFDSKNVSKEALAEILKGGFDKVKECGGSLLGGHTIGSPEMYYGLSVTGVINPKDVKRNNGARAGDVLVLTKPLGMGVLTTAIKRDLLELPLIKHCADIMASLNYLPSRIMKKYRVNSCTDITGFGFLGHAFECINENISFSINSRNVPFVKEAYELCKAQVVPGGSKRNQKFLEDKVSYSSSVDETLRTILCDAQTSGGLLIAINKDDAKEYIKELEELSFGYAKIVGEVIPKSSSPIIVC